VAGVPPVLVPPVLVPPVLVPPVPAPPVLAPPVLAPPVAAPEPPVVAPALPDAPPAAEPDAPSGGGVVSAAVQLADAAPRIVATVSVRVTRAPRTFFACFMGYPCRSLFRRHGI
jgi:hypothetical protein